MPSWGPKPTAVSAEAGSVTGASLEFAVWDMSGAPPRADEIRVVVPPYIGAGERIGAYDTLIAGIALARGCVLATHNVREFGRVAGLHVEDWTALA